MAMGSSAYALHSISSSHNISIIRQISPLFNEAELRKATATPSYVRDVLLDSLEVMVAKKE